MDIIDIERHERGIVRVVMKHAAARNAMGEDLRGALLPAFTELLSDQTTRVIIIASALKDFSVGGDLSKMDTLADPKAGRRRMTSAHRLARVLLAADKPMIAEVRGHAVGAGAGLALVCDTIVMGETASMGFPFPRVGLTPDFAIAYTLPKRIGFARARQALLYSRSFKGPDALAIGLADDVVADEAVSATAMERAREIAALPSHAAALTKRMLEHAHNAEAVLDFEAMAQPLCFASDDFREGLAAFREKRKPNFDPGVA
ncbi:enoyl-CoA hydratase/isomerase family protein [Microvirga antarctica]|uniref:enoyl-CoA hydratase/isomerase family protein n=1 Tax=Microvirga antarctica TaxID=2819233 RepID=UPI001B303738|nr:enoyl-CoA hydratase/isomerase family protein [Microvirga antarctica]